MERAIILAASAIGAGLAMIAGVGPGSTVYAHTQPHILYSV